jgi:hypothetical protein
MFILNINDNFKLKIFVIGNHLAKFEYNLLFHLGEWSHCHVNFFPFNLQNKGLGETNVFIQCLIIYL